MKRRPGDDRGEMICVMATKHHPTPEEPDEPVILPVPAEVAVPTFLVMDPAGEPVEAVVADTDSDPDTEDQPQG